MRGGLVYLDEVRRSQPRISGVVTATRGNHGQSIAYAATRLGLAATIVVPHGNSVEKNRAMAAFGARLVEEGHDFQAAYEHAVALAERETSTSCARTTRCWCAGWRATASNCFARCPISTTVYVPIGLGSGICGVIAAREALGPDHRDRRRRRRRARRPMRCPLPPAGRSAPIRPTRSPTAWPCGCPTPPALEVIRRGAARIVTVSEAEIRQAMRILFTDTHNVAEGAGAAATRRRLAGTRPPRAASGSR